MPDFEKDSFTKDIPANGVIVLSLFITFIPKLLNVFFDVGIIKISEITLIPKH
jgi:hypothetical protein